MVSMFRYFTKEIYAGDMLINVPKNASDKYFVVVLRRNVMLDTGLKVLR